LHQLRGPQPQDERVGRGSISLDSEAEKMWQVIYERMLGIGGFLRW
jgi:hypothetical protein